MVAPGDDVPATTSATACHTQELHHCTDKFNPGAGTAFTEISNDRLHLALTAPAARLALALGAQVAAGTGGGSPAGSPSGSPSGSSGGSPAMRSPARRARSRGARGGRGSVAGVCVMQDVQEDAFRRYAGGQHPVRTTL